MKVNGTRLEGTAQYYISDDNPEAKAGYALAQKGRAAYSVGFIPDMSKATKLENGNSAWPNYEFNGQELLEVSQVSMPSNPDALQYIKSLNLPTSVRSLVDAALDDATDEVEREVEREDEPITSLSTSLDAASSKLIKTLW